MSTPPADPRHVGWCRGGRMTATAAGACPVCGYVGRVTKYGLIATHKDRRRTK